MRSAEFGDREMPGSLEKLRSREEQDGPCAGSGELDMPERLPST